MSRISRLAECWRSRSKRKDSDIVKMARQEAEGKVMAKWETKTMDYSLFTPASYGREAVSPWASMWSAYPSPMLGGALEKIDTSMFFPRLNTDIEKKWKSHVEITADLIREFSEYTSNPLAKVRCDIAECKKKNLKKEIEEHKKKSSHIIAQPVCRRCLNCRYFGNIGFEFFVPYCHSFKMNLQRYPIDSFFDENECGRWQYGRTVACRGDEKLQEWNMCIVHHLGEELSVIDTRLKEAEEGLLHSGAINIRRETEDHGREL